MAIVAREASSANLPLAYAKMGHASKASAAAAMPESPPHLTLVPTAPTTLEEKVADARSQLTLCVDEQREVAGLADDIAALEVECIEADLVTGKSATNLSLSPQDAGRLGTLLKRKQALEEELASLLGTTEKADSDETRTASLEAGVAALEAWLDAPHVKESKRAETLARIVLLMAVFILGWAAWIFHPALLVLIIPIAGPISLILRRGENTEWRRMGARQKFDQTGLPKPKEWDEEHVRKRLEEVTRERDLAKAQPLRVEDVADEETRKDARFGELSIEQVDIELALNALLNKAGVTLDELTDAQLTALEKAAEAGTARQRLAEVRKRHDLQKTEFEDRKQRIYNLLSENGVAPDGGRADIASLSAGLSELEARL